jgi:hypothetical protein
VRPKWVIHDRARLCVGGDTKGCGIMKRGFGRAKTGVGRLC